MVKKALGYVGVEAMSDIEIRDERTRGLIVKIKAGTKGKRLKKRGFEYTVLWEGHGVQRFEYDPDSMALKEGFSGLGGLRT
jgi:hypothetical protein